MGWEEAKDLILLNVIKYNADSQPLPSPPRIPVYVPTGVACFPNELMHTPKLWVEQKYRKLVSFTPMPRGGHFAAMEEPQLMAEDIQKFTKIVEKMRQ